MGCHMEATLRWRQRRRHSCSSCRLPWDRWRSKGELQRTQERVLEEGLQKGETGRRACG